MFRLSRQRATKPIPVLHVSSVSCGMGESVAIGNETLSVDDVTTPPNQLLITLNSLPEQGRLVRIISYHGERFSDFEKIGSASRCFCLSFCWTNIECYLSRFQLIDRRNLTFTAEKPKLESRLPLTFLRFGAP